MSSESTAIIPEQSFSQRLKLDYVMYLSNPIPMIKQLLGNDIYITNIVENDIITADDSIVIDVTYRASVFSRTKIYYVKTKDVQQLTPNSDKHVVKIDGTPVKLSSSRLKEFKNVIPVLISEKLSNTFSTTHQIDNQFAFYAKLVTDPMNKILTPLRYVGSAFQPFIAEKVDPIYPESFKPKTMTPLSNESLIDSYKAATASCNSLKLVDRFSIVNSFSECTHGSTGYIIEFSKIPSDNILKGIILITSKRNPYQVMFVPSKSQLICVEEMISIADFLEQDVVNYINYCYMTEVLNK